MGLAFVEPTDVAALVATGLIVGEGGGYFPKAGESESRIKGKRLGPGFFDAGAKLGQLGFGHPGVGLDLNKCEAGLGGLGVTVDLCLVSGAEFLGRNLQSFHAGSKVALL